MIFAQDIYIITAINSVQNHPAKKENYSVKFWPEYTSTLNEEPEAV